LFKSVRNCLGETGLNDEVFDNFSVTNWPKIMQKNSKPAAEKKLNDQKIWRTFGHRF
jgi:hypothetical protein